MLQIRDNQHPHGTDNFRVFQPFLPKIFFLEKGLYFNNTQILPK